MGRQDWGLHLLESALLNECVLLKENTHGDILLLEDYWVLLLEDYPQEWVLLQDTKQHKNMSRSLQKSMHDLRMMDE